MQGFDLGDVSWGNRIINTLSKFNSEHDLPLPNMHLYKSDLEFTKKKEKMMKRPSNKMTYTFWSHEDFE